MSTSTWSSRISYISSPIGHPSLPEDDPPQSSTSLALGLGLRIIKPRRAIKDKKKGHVDVIRPQEIWLEDEEPDWKFTGNSDLGLGRLDVDPPSLTISPPITTVNRSHSLSRHSPTSSVYDGITTSPKFLPHLPKEYHYKRKHSTDSIVSLSSSSGGRVHSPSSPNSVRGSQTPPRPPRPPALSADLLQTLLDPPRQLDERRISSSSLLEPGLEPEQKSPRDTTTIGQSSTSRQSVITRRNSELFSDPYRSSTSSTPTSASRPISSISSVGSMTSISSGKKSKSSKSNRSKKRNPSAIGELPVSLQTKKSSLNATSSLESQLITSSSASRANNNKNRNGVASFTCNLQPLTPPPTQPIPPAPTAPSPLRTGKKSSSHVPVKDSHARSRRRSHERSTSPEYQRLAFKTISSESLAIGVAELASTDHVLILEQSLSKDLLLEFPLPPARTSVTLLAAALIHATPESNKVSSASASPSPQTNLVPMAHEAHEETVEVPQSPGLPAMKMTIEDEANLNEQSLTDLGGESSDVEHTTPVRPSSPTLQAIMSSTPRPRKSVGSRVSDNQVILDSGESDLDLELPLSVLAVRERVSTPRSTVVQKLARKSSSSINPYLSRRISTMHLQDGRALTRGRGWSDSEDDDDMGLLPRKLSQRMSPRTRKRPTLVMSATPSESDNQVNGHLTGTERYSMLSSSSSIATSSTLLLTPSSSRNNSRTSPGLEIASGSGWPTDHVLDPELWGMQKAKEQRFIDALSPKSGLFSAGAPTQTDIQHWGEPEVTIEAISPKTLPTAFPRDRSASNPVLSLPRRTSVVSKKSYQSPASRTPPPSAFCQTLPPSQATTPTGVPRLACTERKSAPSSNHAYVSPTPQLARHSLVKMLHGNATSSTTTSHVGDNNASFVSAIPRSPFAAAWGARRATFTPTSA